LTLSERTLAGSLAAIAPDIDYVVLPEFDPPFQFRICKPRHARDWGQVTVSRNLSIGGARR
jgi:hypothetical protein